MFQLRERGIFETLRLLEGLRFVVIGGYAVNAYTLPRFSVDCDIVVEDKTELKKVENKLMGLGYKKMESTKHEPFVDFARYEKILADSFDISFDILIKDVVDRQTGVSISADWIFKNSKVRSLKGKTIIEALKVRIINIDALFAMKMISCRSTDIRDMFMMAPALEDKNWVKTEVSSRYDFNERLKRVKTAIVSGKFRYGLQGVYGIIDSQAFGKSVKAVTALEEA